MDVEAADLARLVETLRAAGCVWAEDEARLLADAAESPATLEAMVARRCSGVPIEHVVGSARFCGLDVRVADGVFIPRRRTEYLARCAVTVARGMARRHGGVRALDVCCGSGAIALVLATRVPGVDLWATDVSEAATACARRNLGTRATVLTGDLFDPLPSAEAGSFDMIVANTPYVPTREIPALPSEARCFEPAVTYDGGEDGLALVRRLFDEAGRWLSADGVLLTETSLRQAAPAEAAARRPGFRAIAKTSAVREAAVIVMARGTA